QPAGVLRRAKRARPGVFRPDESVDDRHPAARERWGARAIQRAINTKDTKDTKDTEIKKWRCVLSVLCVEARRQPSWAPARRPATCCTEERMKLIVQPDAGIAPVVT